MMMGEYEMLDLLEDDNNHSLLEPPTPAYTSVTVRRAFIVWFYCGQKNEFRQVCNYFHYLESLEDKLSPKSRAASRLHELNLLSNRPPSSDYLNTHFPKLYRQNKYSKFNANKGVREPRLEDCIFGFEGYYDLKIHKGLTTKEIIKISQMIRKYCKIHSKTLNKFLQQFIDVVKKTDTEKTVSNLSVYIKNKYIEDELETYKHMPKDFGFLNVVEDNISDIDESGDEGIDANTSPADIYDMYNGRTSPTKIRNLINEVSRKEHLMNWLPQLPEIAIGDCENTKGPNENFISTKILEAPREMPDDEYESESKI